MNLQLILAGPYEACNKTGDIWKQSCEAYQLELEILDLESETGQSLEKELNIKSFPALIADKQVVAVGHPDKDSALLLISQLIKRQ